LWSYDICSVGIDFKSVEVISDSDFDDQHSAGSSLGDIVLFKAKSFYPYIIGGYQPKNCLYDEKLRPIERVVSDLIEEDLIMLAFGGTQIPDGVHDTTVNILFTTSPILSKTHNITVTMTADDGRVFEDTVQVSWE
jgi:hypothetical protein